MGVLHSMHRLTRELPNVNLALSLHAPNQEIRLKIVPTASANSIEKLLAAVDMHIAAMLNSSKAHPAKFRAGVMIEYILIHDINDRHEHAHELGSLLMSRRDHILLNLIPYNPTEVAVEFMPPTEEAVGIFHQICCAEPYLLHTRVRQEMGQDIAGACGQLALVRKSTDVPATDVEDLVGNRFASHSKSDMQGKHQGSTTTAGIGDKRGYFSIWHWKSAWIPYFNTKVVISGAVAAISLFLLSKKMKIVLRSKTSI